MLIALKYCDYLELTLVRLDVGVIGDLDKGIGVAWWNGRLSEWRTRGRSAASALEELLRQEIER